MGYYHEKVQKNESLKTVAKRLKIHQLRGCE